MKKWMLCWALLGSAWANADALNDIMERGVLRVAIHESAYPFSYKDAEGQWRGADVAIAEQLAEALLGSAAQLELFPVANRDRVPALKGGEVDVVLANFTKTRSRAQVVDFSHPYMKVNMALISENGQAIRNLSDLQGKKLIVKEASSAERFFLDHYKNIELLAVKSDDELFDALQQGLGVAAVHDDTLLWSWELNHPRFGISMAQIGDTDFIAAAVEKGEKALLGRVNEAMQAMKEDGRLQRIYEETLVPAFGAKRIHELWVE